MLKGSFAVILLVSLLLGIAERGHAFLQAAPAPAPEGVRNGAGLQLVVAEKDNYPTLRIVLPGHPASDRAVSLGWATSNAEAQPPKKITDKEAHRLVLEAVKVHNRGAEVKRTENSYDREFLYFEVIVANQVASPVVGHFAVNPWTGDVWNPALCQRVILPRLQKMQSEIKKKAQFSDAAYSKLRDQAPLCH